MGIDTKKQLRQIAYRLTSEGIRAIGQKIPRQPLLEQEYETLSYEKRSISKRIQLLEGYCPVLRNSGHPRETLEQKNAKAYTLENIIGYLKVLETLENKLTKEENLSVTETRLVNNIHAALQNTENASFSGKVWHQLATLFTKLAKCLGFELEVKTYSGAIKASFWDKDIKRFEEENPEVKPTTSNP